MATSHRPKALLSAADAKRRIHSARILRGMSQEDLDAAGARLGLGVQELSRTERGKLPFTAARAMFLCRILDVPMHWFEADRVELSDLQAAA